MFTCLYVHIVTMIERKKVMDLSPGIHIIDKREEKNGNYVVIV